MFIHQYFSFFIYIYIYIWLEKERKAFGLELKNNESEFYYEYSIFLWEYHNSLFQGYAKKNILEMTFVNELIMNW